MAGQNANAVNITGGTISGVTLSGLTFNNPTVTGGTFTNSSFTTPTIANPTFSGAATGSLANLSLSNATISNSTLTNPTISTPTVTNGVFTTPTINNPTITGGSWSGGTLTGFTLSNPTVNGGKFYPTTLSIAASYTIDPGGADCSKLIIFTGGANQTLALGSVPVGCNIDISNQIGHAWHVSATGPGTLWVSPGQYCRASFNGTAWRSNCPYRYFNVNSNQNVGISGCSDSNDGLTADSSGYLCTLNAAFNNIKNYIDNGNGIPQVSLSSGTFAAASYASLPPGGADQISVVGNGINNTTISSSVAGTAAVTVRDYGVLTLNQLSIACTNTFGAYASQFATIDLNSVQFSSCTGGAMIAAGNDGHVNCSGGSITINGNANNFILAQDGGNVTCTVLVGISMAVNMATSFMEATAAGAVNVQGITFSNAGFVSGVRYIIAYLGRLDTGSGGNVNFLPGSAPGTNPTTFPAGGFYN